MLEHSSVKIKNKFCLVLELAEGGELFEKIIERTKFNEPEVCAIYAFFKINYFVVFYDYLS